MSLRAIVRVGAIIAFAGCSSWPDVSGFPKRPLAMDVVREEQDFWKRLEVQPI